MTNIFIQRQLWYVKNNGEHVAVTQDEVLNFLNPVVVLGEAGMGKSELLKRLAKNPGYCYCTARKLINSGGAVPLVKNGDVLVIDALDEWSSLRDGDAVNQVLRCLAAFGRPRFIISCRVADWRSATGVEAIKDFYDRDPIEMHLKPLVESDAFEMLSIYLNPEMAGSIVKHFNECGLEGLLGNPQTMELIVRVAECGNLPNSAAELFQKAVDVLWKEHKDTKAANQHSKARSLDAAGAAFAALILTGNDSISRLALTNIMDGEIPIAEIERLPGGEMLSAVIDTRLFAATSVDRFGYWHRRIGEFVGAGWLSRHSNTPRKRRRLLAMFNGEGLVPASLRGIHAWLSKDSALAEAVIAADPMGVIEYGDADNLTPSQARALLSALRKLAAENPRFHDWREHSANGLFQMSLLNEIKEIVSSNCELFSLRLMILRAIKKSSFVTLLSRELCEVLLDEKSVFVIRKCAGEALARRLGIVEWQTIFAKLLLQNSETSLRLGIELLDDVGYKHLSAMTIAEFIMSHCRKPGYISGVLSSLSVHMPIEHAISLLDIIVSKGCEAISDQESKFDFSYSMHRLVKRAIEANLVEAEQLWNWLKVLNAGHLYNDATNDVAASLEVNADLRRALQTYIGFDEVTEKDVRSRIQRLIVRRYGLYPTEEDVVFMLNELYRDRPHDIRWRQVVELVAHDSERGAAVRRAAHRFAISDATHMSWLKGLPNQPMTAWEMDNAREEAAREAKELLNREGRILDYRGRRTEIRMGSHSCLINPALVYLGQIYGKRTDLTPVDRITHWLSPDLADDVKVGFEAFLLKQPPMLTASQMARSFQENTFSKSIYIVVAALCERLRIGKGYDDLSNERLMVGLCTTLIYSFGEVQGFKNVQPALVLMLRRRGIWAEVLQELIEPQLRARQKFVYGLNLILQSTQSDSSVATLMQDWLLRFRDLPIEIESQVVDWLIEFKLFDVIRIVLCDGCAQFDHERSLMWASLGLIVDFEITSERLSAEPIKEGLLWQIRDRLGRGELHTTLGSTELSAWIVANFRPLYPYTSYPTTSMGDTNGWDATQFLLSQLKRIGNDVTVSAINTLKILARSPVDGYTESILSICAEQARLLVESNFKPATLDSIVALTYDAVPVSSTDLQAYMIEELNVVQRKIRSDDTDSWRGFFDDGGKPHKEDRCRDYLLLLLRQSISDVALAPEGHVLNDKEVDISCEAGVLRMPIEVKGQWHNDLWHAADSQLDRLYASDWRAEGRGVYLVLWFGCAVPKNKRMKSAGRGIKAPSSALELETMLKSQSKGAFEGRLAIFVLDLERSAEG